MNALLERAVQDWLRETRLQLVEQLAVKEPLPR